MYNFVFIIKYLYIFFYIAKVDGRKQLPQFHKTIVSERTKISIQLVLS